MERLGDCTEQVDQKWGKRRRYDADFKIMVVNAVEVPNNCQPAKKYGVMECNDRRWRVQKDRLKTLTVREKLIVVV